MVPRAKKPAAAKPIFRGCVVALAGPDLGRDGWAAADVERWVGVWGGGFAPDLTDDVTHLLATAAQFNDGKNNARIARAKKAKDLHIVNPDWLEDSITHKRRLPEKPYSLREAQRRENARRKLSERAEKGIEKGKRLVNDCVNHIYSDSTFFRYEIELTRNDEQSGNAGQKYQICIWESNAKPHHYQMVVKYYRKPRDGQPGIHRFPEDAPGRFEAVFAHFRRFFQKKTRIDWDERLAKAGSQPPKYWQYQPPTGGKPVGLVNGVAPALSIFGDGRNIVIPALEMSGEEEGGGDSSSSSSNNAASSGPPTTTTPPATIPAASEEATADANIGYPEEAKLAAEIQLLAYAV